MKGIVIIRSKSTNKSEPSCANPWTIAVRMTRTREYLERAPGTSFVFVTVAQATRARARRALKEIRLARETRQAETSRKRQGGKDRHRQRRKTN